MAADKIYVGGVDLSQYLVPISLVKGFIAPPSLVGQDYQIPGYVGAIEAPIGKGPRTVTFGGLISGSTTVPDGCDPTPIVGGTRALYLSRLAAFASAVYADGRVTSISYVADGFSGTTTCRYLSGLEGTEEIFGWLGRVSVDMLLLNPIWS